MKQLIRQDKMLARNVPAVDLFNIYKYDTTFEVTINGYRQEVGAPPTIFVSNRTAISSQNMIFFPKPSQVVFVLNPN